MPGKDGQVLAAVTSTSMSIEDENAVAPRFTIRTPLGTFEQRDDCATTAWECSDTGAFMFIVRYGIDDPTILMFAVWEDGRNPRRVIHLGASFERATDLEVIREVFRQLHVSGPVTSFAVQEGGGA
jgi:hypothetical protein